MTLSGLTAMSTSQSFPTADTYDITAVYSGDSTFASSTAAVLPLVVTAATASQGTFSLSATPASLTAAPVVNESVTSTSALTITSINGLTGAVALSCAVAPAGGTLPTCTVLPASVILAANGTVSATISIVASGGTSSCNTSEARRSKWLGGASGGLTFASLLLLLLPCKSRRVLRGVALACLLATGLGALSGCGGSNTQHPCPAIVSGGTPAGTYVVRVNGSKGTVTADLTVTLTVN